MSRLVVAVALLLAVACSALAWSTPQGGPTGNRAVRGTGTFPRWQALAIATDAPVRWLVTLPGRRLATVDREGGLFVYEVASAGLRVVARYGGVASPDGPPLAVRLDHEQTGIALVAPDGRLLVWSDGVLRGYDVGGPLSSATLPAPVAVEDRPGQDLLAVARDGAIVLIGGLAGGSPRAMARIEARAPRDARIALADLDGHGEPEAVVLADARDGAAPGDDPAGAASLAVIRVHPYGLEHRRRFALSPPATFADVVPVLAPIGASARPVVLAVRGGPGQALAPLALALRGDGLVLVAEGAGVPARGLHVIGAAALAGEGVSDLVAVSAPGRDGVLTLYRRAGGALVAVTSAAGFAPPSAGPRHPDPALIADLDGDGRPEVVLPRMSREVLVALELRGDRLVERWAVDFKSPITSNLAAADIDGDGALDLAVASRRGLHVFLSVR